MTDKIDGEIERTIEKLKGLDPTEEEYGKLLKNLGTLIDARTSLYPKVEKRKMVFSGDTILTLAVSTIQLLVLLNYERFNVLTGSARNWLLRIK